jgi:hypothetical protein
MNLIRALAAERTMEAIQLEVPNLVEDTATLSETELGAFAHKLNAFAASLSEREREFLGHMLADAAFLAGSDEAGYADLESAFDDDVAGFDMGGGESVISSIFEYGQGISRAQKEVAELAALGV